MILNCILNWRIRVTLQQYLYLFPSRTSNVGRDTFLFCRSALTQGAPGPHLEDNNPRTSHSKKIWDLRILPIRRLEGIREDSFPATGEIKIKNETSFGHFQVQVKSLTFNPFSISTQKNLSDPKFVLFCYLRLLLISKRLHWQVVEL